MKGLALVVGSGGIGKQLATDLSNLFNDLDVILCGRTKAHESIKELSFSISNSQNDSCALVLPHKITSRSLNEFDRSVASCFPIPPDPTTKAKPFIFKIKNRYI